MTDSMHSAGLTDVGQRRDHNEDAILHEPPIFAVADGVGGAAKGEVASALALEALRQQVSSVLAAPDEPGARAAMASAVRSCNEAVFAAQASSPERTGMATTLTAVAVRDDGLAVLGHVGDSRAYLIEPAGSVRQLTEDHSLVAELVRTGQLTPAEAREHPQRNVITRALGTDNEVEPDISTEQLLPGEWLLLCSDGLTGHVTDHELAETVLDTPSAEAASQALIDLANERGGNDNISVVLAQPVPADATTPKRTLPTLPAQQRDVEISGELDVIPIDATHACTASDAAGDVHPAWLGDAPAQQQDASPTEPPIAATPARRPPRQRSRRGARGAASSESTGTQTASRASHPVRTLLIVIAITVIAFAAGSFAWKQSYYLLARHDGSIGINQGFPIFNLNREYKTSDVHEDDLDAPDRAKYASEHRLRSRTDALKLYDKLPELAGRCAPTTDGAGSPPPSGASELTDPNC